MTPSQMFWGLSVYCVCKMNWVASYWDAFCSKASIHNHSLSVTKGTTLAVVNTTNLFLQFTPLEHLTHCVYGSLFFCARTHLRAHIAAVMATEKPELILKFMEARIQSGTYDWCNQCPLTGIVNVFNWLHRFVQQHVIRIKIDRPSIW